MKWQTGEPAKRGEYLAIDRIYRSLSVAHWTPEQGWCIRGRWLGHDGAHCWMATDFLPEPPK